MGSAELSGQLLDEGTVGAYLVTRGLAPEAGAVRAWSLGGGVSNVVLAVEVDGRELVVKQSLPKLRVADEWLAKRERIVTEAAALVRARALTPEGVPRLVDSDPVAFTLTIEHAPAGWESWKEQLLRGDVDPAVGTRLGQLLGHWHDATWGSAEIAARFGDYEAFDQLRLDPYHRTVIERVPAAADGVGRVLRRLETTHTCLVHGDYSPKNVLVGPGSIWVLDFEVAHYGDPVFDVAFMLTHIFLTAIHRPADAPALRAVGLALWEGYERALASSRVPDERDVVAQLACLALARTDGKSLEDYLTPAERDRARAWALALLSEPGSLADAWSSVPA